MQPLSILNRLNLNGRFVTFEGRLTGTPKAGANNSLEKDESFILEK
jgi:hypothetical protein